MEIEINEGMIEFLEDAVTFIENMDIDDPRGALIRQFPFLNESSYINILDDLLEKIEDGDGLNI